MQDSGYELPRIRLMRSSQNSAYANFGELRQSELRRIPLLRTPVHKGLEPPSAGYMEPLWGRETLARQGANADERNADERASPKGSEQQKHPRVGTRALLQQRAYQGGP